MTVWVARAQACESCGGESSLSVLSAMPTDEQLDALKEELGGMYCIRVVYIEVEVDGGSVKAS